MNKPSLKTQAETVAILTTAAGQAIDDRLRDAITQAATNVALGIVDATKRDEPEPVPKREEPQCGEAGGPVPGGAEGSAIPQTGLYTCPQTNRVYSNGRFIGMRIPAGSLLDALFGPGFRV